MISAQHRPTDRSVEAGIALQAQQQPTSERAFRPAASSALLGAPDDAEGRPDGGSSTAAPRGRLGAGGPGTLARPAAAAAARRSRVCRLLAAPSCQPARPMRYQPPCPARRSTLRTRSGSPGGAASCRAWRWRRATPWATASWARCGHCFSPYFAVPHLRRGMACGGRDSAGGMTPGLAQESEASPRPPETQRRPLAHPPPRRSCGAAAWSRCRGAPAPLCTTTSSLTRSARCVVQRSAGGREAAVGGLLLLPHHRALPCPVHLRPESLCLRLSSAPPNMYAPARPPGFLALRST